MSQSEQPVPLTRYRCVRRGSAYHSDETQPSLCNACFVEDLDACEPLIDF